MGTKKDYFEDIKEWEKIDSKVATGIVVLTEEEKTRSGGYDVMVAYWVKRMTERRKKEIVRKLHFGKYRPGVEPVHLEQGLGNAGGKLFFKTPEGVKCSFQSHVQ